MKEITDRNMFGWILIGLEGQHKKVRIIEVDGKEYEGVIIGYTRGGYEVQGELIPSSVRLHNKEYSCRIKIDEIGQLFIGE